MTDINLMVHLAVTVGIALAIWQVLTPVKRRQGCRVQITGRSVDQTSRRVTTER
jgi:hypothetical protein